MNYHIIQIPIFLCHECVFASHFFADVILMIFPSLYSAFFQHFLLCVCVYKLQSHAISGDPQK